MKIVILHLSDLHFKESTKLFPAEKVAATLRQLPDHFLHIFIIISGDIAFSGNKLQYDLASIYLTALVAEIKKNTQVPVDVVAVPGNHDCQFPEDSSVRDLVISHLVREQDSFPSYEKLKQCVGVQDTFFEWLEKNTSNHLIKNDEKLCWTFSRILSSGKQVTFLCINSAWMSSLHESQGQLLFPSQSMPDEVSGDLIIAILHHPYNWFFSSNSREARTYLDNSADLVLTGHEHEAEAFSKTTLNGTNVSYVEGAVLGDPYNKSHSSFNILEIDLESPNCSFYNCDWNKQQYVLSTHTLNGPKIFSRRGRGKMSSYRVSNDMSTILKDPGLNLSHPRKQVEFEDIFIPQNLKTFVVRGKADNIQKELIYSDKIIETLFTEKFTNISGGEYSGKTSLAKFIFLESLNRGLIPILISGNKLKKTKPQHLQDVIIETFQMQYQQPGSQDFLQEPNEKKVLILDDFQEVNFNIKGRAVICEWLLDKFGYVFLMSKDRTQVEEAILDNETLKIWSKFKHYDIAPFGHHQRDRLIEKWVKLGDDHTIKVQDLSHKIQSITKVVNTVLGNNLLPSHPIFVLVVLQQYEAKQPLNTECGAFGYYYELLITGALQKTSGLPEEIDTKYTFLSELAWLINVEKIHEVDFEEMKKFTGSHWSKYRLSDTPERLIPELIEARILRKTGTGYTFSYKYLFYYFLAKFMRSNWTETQVKETFDKMILAIHEEKNANVVIFLTYLYRDRPIIEALINSAKRIFDHVTPCEFCEDMSFLDKLGIKSLQVVLPENDPIENRRKILKKLEMLESAKSESYEDAEQIEKIEQIEAQEEPDEDVKNILDINKAMKSVQILGQILRNFSGSLQADLKFQLAKEAFSLGLRALKVYFNVLEKHLDGVVNYYAEMLGKKMKEMPAYQIRQFAQQVIYILSELNCLTVIKNISAAVGSEKLIPTYDDLERAYSNLATEFIQTSIKLDHFKQFPENKVIELNNKIAKNPLAKTLLQMIVTQHFYLFPRERTIRQSICDRLGIKLNQGRLPLP